MKLLKYKIIFILAIASMFVACETDFNNVNKPSDDQILTTKDGLLLASIGMTDHFTSSSLAPIIEASGLSTREFGNLLTYTGPSELVAGGTALPEDNSITTRLWVRLLQDKGVAESIIANVDGIDMDNGTRSGLKAYAKFFKAMTLGYLVQSFEQVPITNQIDGQAVFSDRATVLAECISLLESAKADLAANAMSTEFEYTIPNMHLPNMINAFLARYNLFAGNYSAAISAANAVDLAEPSEWIYTGTSQNPVWAFAVDGSPDTKPQDNFGLLGDYIPETEDGRIDFYLSASSEVEIDYGFHAVENAVGFFSNASSSIPVYLPGEMLLIKAEAYAMTDLASAEAQINLVRQKTNDVFGVNADLGAWTGDATNQTEVLDEIYKNRCIELFMSGMRLEDSRRIHSGFTPSNAIDYVSERNRNYYPYPYQEKANNTNCPADPSI